MLFGASLLVYKYVDIALTALIMTLLGFERSAIRTRVDGMFDKDPLVLRALLALRGTPPLQNELELIAQPPVGDRGG